MRLRPALKVIRSGFWLPFVRSQADPRPHISIGRVHSSILSLIRKRNLMTSSVMAAPISEEQQYVVKHDDQQKQFYIKISDSTAVLQYDWVGDGCVDLYHTEVPPVFRGKGIGKLLVKAALEHFSEKKTRMVPTCTFVLKYVQDNPSPQYTNLIDSH